MSLNEVVLTIMRVLITGATGQVGPYLLRCLLRRGDRVSGWGRTWTSELFGTSIRAVDLTDREQTATAFREARPDAVVHLAAISHIAQAHRDPIMAHTVNVAGTQTLVDLASQCRCQFIYVSTDMVFNGEAAPYREIDPTGPACTYGRTKLAGEEPVLDFERGLVVRVSLLVGPSLNDRPKFFDQTLTSLRNEQSIRLFTDEWRTMLGLEEAAEAIAVALGSSETGLFHLGGPQRMSRYDLGLIMTKVMGLDPSLVIPASRLEIESSEPRPRDLSLDSSFWHDHFGEAKCRSVAESLVQMLDSVKS